MATIDGTSAPDNLYDTSGDDLIIGYAGDDEIHTSGGADTIYGGNGNDLIIADGGTDKVWGGNGADIFSFAAVDTGDEDVLIIRDFDPSGGLYGDMDRLGVPLGQDLYDVTFITLYGVETTQIRLWYGTEEEGQWSSQVFQLVNWGQEKWLHYNSEIFVTV